MNGRRLTFLGLFKIVALAVTVALVVTACGGDDEEPTATPTTAPRPTQAPAATPTSAPAPTATPVPPTATPQPVFGVFRVDATKIAGLEYPSNKPNFSLTPRRGGVFKHANSLVWPHFDVTEVGASATVTATAPVYSKLLVCKGTLEMTVPNAFSCEVGPQLAQSWSISADGKTYTFRLRQGVKWHNAAPVNGREFTSADIVYTYTRFVAGGSNASTFAFVDKIEAPDKYTVVLTLKSPYADFVAEGPAGSYAYVVPKEVGDRDGNFRNVAIGTGPFVMKEAQGKEKIIYTRNPDYFIPGAPFLDGAEFINIADRQAIRAAYRSGAIHKTGATDILSVAEMNSLRQSNPETMFEVADNNLGLYNLFMRLDKAPFNDIRFRRALSLAINREGIIKSVLEESASIIAPIPWDELFADKPGLDKMPWYKYDVNQAKQLLSQAGLASGFSFKANHFAYTELVRYLPVILDNWNTIGVKVELINQDSTAFNATYRGKTYEQAALGFVLSANSIDGFTYVNMHSKGSGNFGFINDPELDKLLEAQRVEVDPAKRKQILTQVWQREVDNVYRIPFPRVKRINYFSPKLHNYAFSLPMNNAQMVANNIEYFWLE